MTAAPQRVRDILTTATITGSTLVIPQRLTRADYTAVHTVLTAIGGTWSRRDQAHVFPADPSPQLAAILAGAPLPTPARTAEGFVPTPPEIAEQLVREHARLAALGAPRVLEPSAGDGALVDAIRATAPEATIVAVEPNTARADHLRTWPGVSLVTTTFEEYADSLTQPPTDAETEEQAGQETRFDAVVMNPPFAVPGHPTIWIDHIRLAWRLLTPGGRLTAIVPNGYTFRTDRRHTAIRALVEKIGGTHLVLPDDAFGTAGIRAVVLTMDKPRDYLDGTEPAPPRQRGKYQASPDEVAERRAADRDLTQLVHQILDDPAAVARMRDTLDEGEVSAKVLGYSPRNQAMLLTQCEARGIRLLDVDSPAGWRARGRKVRPHVAGLRIVAPRGETHRQPHGETEAATTNTTAHADSSSDGSREAGRDMVLFRMISVFELSQTEPASEPTGNPARDQASGSRRGRGRRAA